LKLIGISQHGRPQLVIAMSNGTLTATHDRLTYRLIIGALASKARQSFDLSTGSLFDHGKVDSPSSNRTARRITDDAMLVWLESDGKEHALKSVNASIYLIKTL